MKVVTFNKRVAKIWTDVVEDSAMDQIANLASLPFMYHHVAIMPDVHAGMGMPIGGVLACVDAVIPNAVGADIGCGMCAVKTSLKVDEVSREVMTQKILPAVRNAIPVGMNHHTVAQDASLMPVGYDINSLKVVKEQYESALHQLGTLGGGNHFIEFQRDDDGYMWIMLHSGSRNLGKRVGDYYDAIASRLNSQWHSAVSPSMNLAFLPAETPEFKAYWDEMNFCVDFAFANRQLMMQRLKEAVADAYPDATFEPMINIAHNYAAWENHFGKDVIVHRKGATYAGVGTTGIIPGSQGTASYIVEGLGNPDSFCSCSHGAGRVLSRKAAVKQLDMQAEVERLEAQGIIHAINSQDDMQEASGAYKDIDAVIANELDLIKVKTRLRPIAVVKG